MWVDSVIVYGSTQWLRDRALDSRLREPGSYLAIDSGGYVYEQPSRIIVHMAECFPEMPRWRLGKQVCQGSKV